MNSGFIPSDGGVCVCMRCEGGVSVNILGDNKMDIAKEMPEF
jgi:hypothetical protein